jgi:outer membrane protein assembly factor BamB
MAPIGSGTANTPVVVGGRVYITSFEGNLYAFVNKTGVAVTGFPQTLSAGVNASSPAVAANIVYAGTHSPDNKLYAFNATTGVPIGGGFPVAVGNTIFAAPTPLSGNVYVPCADGKIYAFNATTGASVPNFPITVGTGTTVQATISIANGRMFEGSLDNNFYAFDATSGAAITGFPRTTGSVILSTAGIVSGEVFFGSEDHDLYGVRRHDGANLQGFPVTTTGSILGGPAIGDGQVVVGTFDQKIFDYSANTGSLRWSMTLDNTVRTSPVIANGIVYANSSTSLYALSEANGGVLWRASVVADTLASPVVADGIVYMGSTDGNLYAFSVKGVLPSSRLPGGERGIKPAISSLAPDYSLKAHKTQT